MSRHNQPRGEYVEADSVSEAIQDLLSRVPGVDPTEEPYLTDDILVICHRIATLSYARGVEDSARVCEGKREYGTSKHGNCCTCTDCKQYHDDCTCEENRILEGAAAAIRSLTPNEDTV